MPQHMLRFPGTSVALHIALWSAVQAVVAASLTALAPAAEAQTLPTGGPVHQTVAVVHAPDAPSPLPVPPNAELIVGFMGGRIHANNLVHKEAVIAQNLQRRNPHVRVVVFANHDGADALKAVLKLLDTDNDHALSPAEKHDARIVIYGHSWGASETINLARSLNARGVPVLLTIQVDSVQKLGENDSIIPPNVQLAVNFYQTEGLLRGRTVIHAQDPAKTKVLVNEEFHYKNAPVEVKQFPWFARTFMGPHIQIENDPRVWDRVEAMLQQTIDGKPVTP